MTTAPIYDGITKMVDYVDGLSTTQKVALAITTPIIGFVTIAGLSFFNNHWGLNVEFKVPPEYKEISLDDDSITNEEKQRRKDIADSCLGIYRCVGGIKPTDEIYERFSKNIRMEDAQFCMDGIDNLKRGFNICAKIGPISKFNIMIMQCLSNLMRIGYFLEKHGFDVFGLNGYL